MHVKCLITSHTLYTWHAIIQITFSFYFHFSLSFLILVLKLEKISRLKHDSTIVVNICRTKLTSHGQK